MEFKIDESTVIAQKRICNAAERLHMLYNATLNHSEETMNAFTLLKNSVEVALSSIGKNGCQKIEKIKRPRKPIEPVTTPESGAGTVGF